MVTAGTVQTMRVTGVPGGYPAEQEANVKVRYIDDVLEVMSDYDVPLLKAIGGIDQFTADNTKIEWILGDTWADRGLVSGSHTSGTNTLTLTTASAHRFPRGTVLKIGDEMLWVVAQASTTTLTVVRGYASSSAAAIDDQAEFRVVGFGEVEGTSITFRGSALKTVPYNYFSVFKQGVSESWMQSEANTYARRGATTPEMMADNLSQFMVAMEALVIEGDRYEGSGVNDPPMTGGLRFFGTSANGATVIDCGGAKLSRALINQGFDASFEAVGASKMARTIISGIGAKRVLWEEYKQGIIRTTPDDMTHREGFSGLENEYGSFSILGPYKRIPDDEMWGVSLPLIEVGHFGGLGRLHEFALPTDGDFNAMGMYGAYGTKFKGIPGIIHWHNFSTT
ncbi:MAG: SU10 major capsid protein [Microbacteriaceae bacterium]